MSWLSDAALERLRRLGDEPPVHERYRVLEEIDRGGMGTVYLAEDLILGRNVALKVLHGLDPDGDAAVRMRREAQILARLEHPGIVPVHDVGLLADGRVFYAMKLVRGHRLDHWWNHARSMAERLRLFERVCEAVAFAHAEHVLHRDLKPENVMVGPFGEVLVMDWGVAKVLGRLERSDAADRGKDGDPTRASDGSTSEGEATPATQTEAGTVLGTPGYMAPEQRLGEPDIDQRADVYALGGVLEFLLTGRPPMTKPSGEVAGSRAASGHAQDEARIPRPLRAIRAKAMAVDPTARYSDAAQLGADVARYLDSERVLAYREGPAQRVGRWLARYRVPVMLVVGYLVMRGILILFRG